VEKKVIDLAGVEIIEKVIGKLKVMAIFRTEKKEQIIGGKVEEGKIVPDMQARVIRKNQILGEIKIKEVESGRTKVKEVAEGQECGMKIEGKLEIEKNDVLELFVKEEEKKYD
jgi:translation initiation factor IF-2